MKPTPHHFNYFFIEKLLEFYLDENPGLHYHILHGIIEDPEDHDEDVVIEGGEIYTLKWSVTVA